MNAFPQKGPARALARRLRLKLGLTMAVVLTLSSFAVTGADEAGTAWVEAAVQSLDHDEEPLRLTASVAGLLHEAWTVRLEGRTVPGAPASDGTVTLAFVDGSPSLAAAQPPMTIPVRVGPDEVFVAEFEMSPLALGAASLLLTLEGDASMSPYYWTQFRIDLGLPAAGDATVVIQQVFPESYTYVEPEWESHVMPELPDEETEVRGEDTLLDGLVDAVAPTMGATATTTLSGVIQIYKPGSSTSSVPCRFCFLEIWDDDCCGNADDKLGTVLTNSEGYFSFPGMNNDDAWSGQDVYVKVVLDHASAPSKVMNGAGTVHKYTSSVLKTDCPNSTCSLGTKTLSPGDEFRRAHFIWETIARGWNLVRNGGPGFDLGKVSVRFPVDVGYTGHTHSSTSAHYHRDLKEIHFFSAVHGANDGPISHEHGHYVMHKAFDFSTTWPTGCPVTGHNIPTLTNQGCAWSEGWATYFSLDARGTPSYTLTSGTTYNHECNPLTNCATWASGDSVEGRVTATLWDLVDNTPTEGSPTDNVDKSITQTWGALRYSRTSGSSDLTFAQYYDTWKSTGFGQSGADFRNAANRNTIMYT